MRYVPHLTLLFLAVLALFVYTGQSQELEKIVDQSLAETKESAETELSKLNSAEALFVRDLRKKLDNNFVLYEKELYILLSEKYDFTEDQLKKVHHKMLNLSQSTDQIKVLFDAVSEYGPEVNPGSVEEISSRVDSLRGFETEALLASGKEIIMVAEKMVSCSDANSKECFVINGLNSDSEISNFNFEEGNEYLLSVNRMEKNGSVHFVVLDTVSMRKIF